MAHAFVLIKFPGDLEAGLRVLATAASTPGTFVQDTGTIVEVYEVSFGNADYSVLLYAPAWGNMVHGVRKLRDLLDEARLEGEERKTQTSTILGMSEEEATLPRALAQRQLCERLEHAQGKDIDTDAADDIVNLVTVETYVKERLKLIAPLARWFAQRSAKVGHDADLYVRRAELAEAVS